MRLLTFLILITTFSTVFAQQSEKLIPKDAVSVFCLNNIQLFQKVSLDELINYDFMEEVQQELFDGSTNGKSLKEAGLDFDQKLNVFYGKNKDYEISGITFGVKDKKQLFSVFDDFEEATSTYQNVSLYTSFFNQLYLQNNSGLLIRVDPTIEKIDQITDSIWYARGNENPWQDEMYYDEEAQQHGLWFEQGQENEAATEEEGNLQKNYFELRDSIQLVYQSIYTKQVCDELFKQNTNLISYDKRFANQVTKDVAGIFYLDNSRSLSNAKNLWYMQTMFPDLYENIKEIYQGNVILGELYLKDQSVEFLVEAQYGQELGSIYQQMNDSKFDKNVLQYIHKDNTAYFSYNVNMRQAYEKAYDVVVPILSEEKNIQVAYNLLVLELLDEYVNKDALFNTYKGSMFGSFNGIKKIKTKKFDFVYDEEFNYQEVEVEAEEDMPIFTLGFTTARGDIPEKVLKHLSRITSRFKNMGNYWVFEEAILDAAPLYMIHQNGLFIFTNDEDLAKNHYNGYGNMSLGSKVAKKIKKNGFMYANVDLGKSLDKFPKDFLAAQQNEMIDALRGKTGVVELTSTKTSVSKTNFKIEYQFTEQENSGKHLLDLINSVYVISR